jgi:hypothetical protein
MPQFRNCSGLGFKKSLEDFRAKEMRLQEDRASKSLKSNDKNI